jgi:hypothetical protein
MTSLLIGQLVTFSWLLPVPFLLRQQPQAFRWFVVCQVASFATEFLSFGLYYLSISPNYTTNLSYVVSLLWISHFFYHAIGWKSIKSSLVIVNVLFFLFAMTNLLFIQKWSPNYYTMTLENLLILGFCILFYYKMLKDLPSTQVQRDPLFLIVSGWFFTHAGQLVLTLVSTYLLAILNDTMNIPWIMFLSLSFFGNLVKTVGAYFQFRNMKAASENTARI